VPAAAADDIISNPERRDNLRRFYSTLSSPKQQVSIICSNRSGYLVICSMSG